MMKKVTIKVIAGLMLLIWLPVILQANNISVTNSELTGKNTTDKFVLVQFDISWENSWMTSSAHANWDAAWVFVKYRKSVANGGDGVWKHARLNNTGHTAPAGSMIETGLLDPKTAFNASTNYGVGAFIYRDADGTGTFTKADVKLRWNYGDNGEADNAALDIEVYAIEMVYVPEGSFYVGTGDSEVGSFTNGSWTSGVTIPFQITSENALDIGQSAGKLWGTSSSGSSTIGSAGTLAASFPKGYGSFYCMKYEISQQGYVDFLNSLTQTQATARKYDKPTPNNRYEITGSLVGEYATTNPYVACNFLTWADLAAYLDWSGLRPMTELEFEKACRGTAAVVPNECAWGTASYPPDNSISRMTLSNAGASDEVIATAYAVPPVGNVAYGTTAYNLGGSGVPGPVRVGIFAGTPANTGRISSGATYYGIMEMSGNLRERPVSVGHATGRLFTGNHGNGMLTGAGEADVTAWPGSNANGTGFRGGSIQGVAVTLQVSDRTHAVLAMTTRNYAYGGRGVRTATIPGK